MVSRPLGAQTRISTEIGASYVRFPDDGISVAGPSIRAALSRETSRLSTDASAGAVTGAGASGWGELSAALRSAPVYSPHVELEGGVATIFGSGSASTATGIAALRLVYPFARAGAWLRGGVSARRESAYLGGHGVDAGGWWRWAGGTISGSLLRQHATGQLFLGPRRTNRVGTVPVRYTQADARLDLQSSRATFSLGGSLRRDPDAEQTIEPAVRASAAFWQSPTRAFVLTVARDLPDYVRGADAARSISLGLRFGESAPDAPPAGRARATIQVSGEEEHRTIRVRAPGAHRVEVMGDFTGWDPIELSAAGELFVGELALAAGTHRMVLRIDGGEWVPAANTPAVDDDFGGRVGLLVVP